ncbi:hypothetical protein GCM10011531_10400 [Aquaticitalea lipolytica]|uniref:Uncharacterized protein n=1 Tax=Aquaticitalea lipolytica TaxID=1247562 RepID=A0A8J2TQ95_9FLAO|nr:hypothetical protein [Aquaticitalea lipolytica]GFZ81970.1 hypothetical protein GCM10011531_10400 [Aquaticitalea lipolytica]|tara:strand:+ start:460 stop:627 length:168 start_codon:yes stop_codon:yes gene_type:complete
MKTLKITLLLALFLSVSSQSDKTPTNDEANTYKSTKTHYDLLAHSKKDVLIPTQG